MAIPGAAKLAQGIPKGAGTLVAGLAANKPGKYFLVCGVPGHLQAGMWDRFTVSASAKTPSIQGG